MQKRCQESVGGEEEVRSAVREEDQWPRLALFIMGSRLDFVVLWGGRRTQDSGSFRVGGLESSRGSHMLRRALSFRLKHPRASPEIQSR